jgi:hypothetical protein
LTDVSYYHFLKRKEMFRNSISKIIGPRSHVSRIHNYLQWKAREEFGVDSAGIYVLDSERPPNSYCNKQIKSPFVHQSSVIEKLLDSDYIDTENTDYTYLQEESDYECESDSHKDLDLSGEFEFTFNGKAVSLYNTEVMSESNTAPEST